MPSQADLIISSYNQPKALELVLAGVLTQTTAVDRILIGDDGSEKDTAQLVASFAKTAPFPVEFTTQDDAGFRKSRALNNAIRKATGRYLLFLDGDCIPPPDWVRNYLRVIERGVDFATAGYVYLTLERLETVSLQQIAARRINESCSAEERQEFKRIHRKEQFYRMIRKPKKPKILGGNWAATRESIEAVNGFDEGFDGFGKEDSDMRNRLRNSGFNGRSLWDHNWVFHCSHDLDPRRNLPQVVRSAPDYDYYESRKHATSCELGLRQSG